MRKGLHTAGFIAEGEYEEARLIYHQEHSQPLMDELKAWVDQMLAESAPNDVLTGEYRYLVNHWEGLIAFLRISLLGTVVPYISDCLSYLDYTSCVGENMKYFVLDNQDRALASLLFGSSAWSVQARDEHIGWGRDGNAICS